MSARGRAGPRKTLRKTLPRDLDVLLERAAAGEPGAALEALEACSPDARGGVGKGTVLMARACPPDIARWAVARGTDVNATDTWGMTALHASAQARFHWKTAPDVLLELGADVHARTRAGLTPLHCAADGKHVAAARVLLAHGADVHAASQDGLTPLEYALQRMSNLDLAPMVPVVEALLAAGATPTDRCRDFVLRAAKTFEFHRAGFAPAAADAASEAAAWLCRRFGVEPPAARRLHDGSSPIVAKAATWQARHAELWALLVPSSGACATVQGEVVRIAGRVADELRRNGGVNWDADYDAMVAALEGHLASHVSLPEAELARARAACREARSQDAAVDALAEAAVAWVALNPTPVALAPPPYRR